VPLTFALTDGFDDVARVAIDSQEIVILQFWPYRFVRMDAGVSPEPS